MGLRQVIGSSCLAALLGCASASPWGLSRKADLTKLGVPPSYARSARERDTTKILRYHALAIPARDIGAFSDTTKPNALAIYPVADERESFYSPDMRKILAQLRRGYDLRVVIAATEGDVRHAIRTTQDLSLLILAGHGSRDTISLGAPNPSMEPLTAENEHRGIDLSDDDLWPELRRLRPDGTILLLSCLTGEGGRGAENLANRVREATGRRVIAAALDVNSLSIKSLAPFDARLIACSLGPLACVDATYVPE